MTNDNMIMMACAYSTCALTDRSLVCAQAVKDLQAEVLVQGCVASTAHFLISFPDQKLRQRLLRDLGEQPEVASAAANSAQPAIQKALDDDHDAPAPPRTPEAAQVLEVPRRTAPGSPFSAPKVQESQPNGVLGAAGNQAAKGRGGFNVSAKAFVPSRPPSMSSLVSEDRLPLAVSEEMLPGPSEASAAMGKAVSAAVSEQPSDALSEASADVPKAKKKKAHNPMAEMMKLFPIGGPEDDSSTESEGPSAPRQTTPVARTSGPVRQARTEEIVRFPTFQSVPNKFDRAEVVGCNSSSLKQYLQMPCFGMKLSSLANSDDSASKDMCTALVMFDVISKELHGLWEAAPGTIPHPDDPDQVSNDALQCVKLDHHACLTHCNCA